MALLSLSRYQAIRIKNTLLACMAAVFLSVVLIYASFQHLAIYDFNGLLVLLLILWGINLAVIGAILFDVNLHAADPSLSLFQMYWGTTFSVVALACTRDLDALYVIFILLPMVFGIFRITVSQFNFFGIYTVTVLLFAVVIRDIWFFPSANFAKDIFMWAIVGMSTFILKSMCNSIVKLRNRLTEKNQELEKALEAKGLFLANMSHEIRTPMNGVLGMLDHVLKENLDQSQRKYLKIAKSSASSLLTVINDILDYSKIEAGKMDLDPVDFYVRELLDEVMAIFSSAAIEKRLKLNVFVAGNVPKKLNADCGKLRQILNNLVGNAVKFTSRGSVDVRVDVAGESEKQLELIFRIEDTGIGIDNEVVDSLFESFTQADITTTRKYGGTGLGLAIAKEISELMGGGVSVVSRPGYGSTFTVNIFACKSEDSEGLKAGERAECTQSSFAGKRVLLVEDNATNQEVACLSLETLGLDADIAENGGDALDKLEASLKNERPYDLIFMDCQMPVLDGYQTTQIVRADKNLSHYKNVPIIALTANAMSGDKEKCLRAGMSDYMCKPLAPDSLCAMLTNWLGEAPPKSNFDDLKNNQPELKSTESDIREVWDYEALLNVVGGKADRVKRLVNSFLTSLDEMERNIFLALGKNDSEALRQSAHALKGAAANLRANKLSDLAGVLESAAHDVDWETATSLKLDLTEMVNGTKKEMKGFVESQYG